MANRTTVKNNIVAQNVPTVTNAILTGMLNTELADNVKFREDVANSFSMNPGSVNLLYNGLDRMDIIASGGNVTITLPNGQLFDGETKYLLLTKTSGATVTWIGVTDITPIKANADSLSLVLYEIVRKGTNYFAKAWVENVKQATDTILGAAEIATAAECNSLTDILRIVTPGRIPVASTTQRGIIEHATSSQINAGTSGNLAVIASELKRKYDELVDYTDAEIAAALLIAADASNIDGNIGSASPNKGYANVRYLKSGNSGYSMVVNILISESTTGDFKYWHILDDIIPSGTIRAIQCEWAILIRNSNGTYDYGNSSNGLQYNSANQFITLGAGNAALLFPAGGGIPLIQGEVFTDIQLAMTLKIVSHA
jgi:hypothetical protein